MKKLLRLFGLLAALSLSAQCDLTLSGPDTMCLTPSTPAVFSVDYSGTGTILWSSNASGIFGFENNNGFYYPGMFDVNAPVTVTATISESGPCDGLSFSSTLTVLSFPTINVGSDVRACINDASVNLVSTIPVIWSTSGSGTFSLSSKEDSVDYYLSPADKTASEVYIKGTADHYGCAASDSLKIIITPDVPTVDAGPDQTICSSETFVLLAGVSSSSEAYWSTDGDGLLGNGTPFASDSISYMPLQSGWNAATITFTLTAYGCTNATDQMVLTITPTPTVSVTPTNTLKSASVNVTATVQNAGGIIWTTSGSGSFSNATTLNTVYILSATDLSNPDPVYLAATTTGNGICPADSAFVSLFDNTLCSQTLSIIGTDLICAGDSGYFEANVDAPEYQWQGNGTFSSPNGKSTYYIPGPADTTTEVGFIYLKAISPGCELEASKMLATRKTNAPVVSAGPDQIVCANIGSIKLNGSADASYSSWSTTGEGTFSSPNLDTARYVPSLYDIAMDSVKLIYQATRCGVQRDTVTITFKPLAVVNAGPDQPIDTLVLVSASVVNASSVQWHTTGNGYFDDEFALSTYYHATAQDMDSAGVVLYIYTLDAECENVSDFLILTDTPEPDCHLQTNIEVNDNEVIASAEVDINGDNGAYYWNFDDGTQVYGQEQNHVYNQTGTFVIQSYFFGQEGEFCTTWDTVVISGITVPTYSISGTVTAGGNPAGCTMTLFELDSTGYYRYQRSNYSYAGTYGFNNVRNGTYLLLAIPYTEQESYQSTYYENATEWENATPLIVDDAALTDKNITLIGFTPVNNGWNQGLDTIQGTVSFESSNVSRVTGAAENPVQFAVISLYNSNGELLTSTSTNEFGYYSFLEIAAGNYTIKIEYPGGNSTSSSYAVSADGDPSTPSVVESEMGRTSVTLHTSDAKAAQNFSVYPNPVQLELFIKSDSENTVLTIYNSLGVVMLTQQISAGVNTVNTKALAPGAYHYVLESGNAKTHGTLVK